MDSEKYRLTVLSNKAEFLEIAGQWQDLVQRCSSASLFTSWAWLCHWLQYYHQESHRLHVLLCYQDNKLIAAFPAYYQRLGLFSVLQPIGYGEDEEAEVASEYPDILIDDSVSFEEMKPLFYAELKQWMSGMRYIYLKNMVKGSALFQIVDQAQEHNCIDSRLLGYRYCIKLPTDVDSFFDQLISKNFRYQLRRAFKKVKSSEEITIQIAGSAEDFQHFYQDLKQLHEDRWQKDGKEGAFTQDIFNRFHMALITSSHNEKEAQPFILKITENDTPRAAIYGYVFKDTFYFYQSGVYMESKGLPYGVAAHALAIEYCIQQGLQYYDFMKGGLTSYKEKYDAHKTEMFDVFCFANQLQKNASKVERKIIDRIKRII
ncbi:GNAT family N-acetyltransferase [Teredinibacter sp. KSP-S5-2]|uniref:GNAT family N-acetyltransferase n=1 Tax=Teredinibacter sp. KSP-S5-2 TaxID=3034506 RepID=UPI0029352540|nr:GNAT family N-acetyltransferase [Teredinibacter sp. KSP-S5-2]WNO09054.1 GNAT family N-acetyltransferase [Teredinibacter sp. KSP-S5-2]